jgi:hypothetical protein
MLGYLGAENAKAWGTFQTQDGRKFFAKMHQTGIRIFDYNGTEYPVDYEGNNTAYLAASGRWSFCTVKNKVYAANDAIITAMSSTTNTYWNGNRNAAILQVLGGLYGKTYSITIDGVLYVQFKTVNGSEASHSEYVGTVYIATVLKYLLDNPTALTSGPIGPGDIYRGSSFYSTALPGSFTKGQAGDLLTIINTADFTIEVNDDYNNVNFKAMNGTVNDEADLPKSAQHNYVVRVAQQNDPTEDLWLRFISDVTTTPGQGFGQAGAWYECLAPGYSIGIIYETLPRVITFDGTRFKFAVETWALRTVGTETTNPTPSFVGYGINDMALFQSRLVFVAGSSVVMSRSKKYTNFFVGSATTIAADDPIDITSQAAFASELKYAIPHNKDLVIFSNQGQFIVFGRTTATPSATALVLTTSFEADMNTKPSACGRNIFFATQYGRFTGIREFYTEGGTDINDTRPATTHVKEYLLGRSFKLTSTSNYDTLIVHTGQYYGRLGVYQFLWSDNTKIQSAWSTWDFEQPPVFSFFDAEDLYIISESRDSHSGNWGGYYLQRLSLDTVAEDELTYHVHLANKFDVSGVHTQFELPVYPYYHVWPLTIVQAAGCPNPGLPVKVLSIVYNSPSDRWVVTLADDMNGGHIIGGTNFTSEYWPTIPRMTDASGDVISNARLTITQFLVSLQNTGYIAGQKISKWSTNPIVEFEGYLVSSVSSIVGQPALDDYIFHMPFKEKVENAEVKFSSDKHWPMTLLDIEWEGTVNKRGKRLTIGPKGNDQ